MTISKYYWDAYNPNFDAIESNLQAYKSMTCDEVTKDLVQKEFDRPCLLFRTDRAAALALGAGIIAFFAAGLTGLPGALFYNIPSTTHIGTYFFIGCGTIGGIALAGMIGNLILHRRLSQSPLSEKELNRIKSTLNKQRQTKQEWLAFRASHEKQRQENYNKHL